jgi:hypothetical protein
MNGSLAVPRKLAVFAIVLPLAVMLGYVLATPSSFNTRVLVGLVVGVLSIPILLRWHYVLLIFSWNMAVNLFFLPGEPNLWMALAGASLLIAFLDRLLSKVSRLVFVPSVSWPLLFMVLVVAVTAKLTGGIGLRSFGAETYGGKRYFYIFIAVVGFFALVQQTIPLSKGRRYASMFFLSGTTAMVSNLIYLLGPTFYFLYMIFPVENVMAQAIADITSDPVKRMAGMAFSGLALMNLMLVHYGIRGVLDLKRPWRVIAFSLVVFGMLLGGFRSSFMLLALTLTVQFFMEGLHRTRLLLVFVLVTVLAGALLVPFARYLPLPIQRSLTVLPIEVDPIVLYDAMGTTDWRVRMWKQVSAEIPQYLLLGKGCSINPMDMYLVEDARRRGFYADYEPAMVAGNYHSGPLTILIPFGIWGMIAFLWFSIASLIVLYKNFKFSPAELKLANAFLFSYFLVRWAYFLIAYGHFAEDFYVFTGIVGLNIALNGGVRKATEVAEDPSPCALAPAPVAV